jgi:hypothetical protein
VQISTVEGRFGGFLAIFGKNAGKTAFRGNSTPRRKGVRTQGQEISAPPGLGGFALNSVPGNSECKIPKAKFEMARL